MPEPASPPRDPASPLILDSPAAPVGRTTWPGWFIPAGVLLAVLALAMGGMTVAAYIHDGRMRIDPSATATIQGDVTLFRGVTNLDGVLCEGRGEFAEVHSGAQVTVTDAAGKVVALGRLGPGKLHGGGICQWQFVVSGVPRGQDFYGVEIAHRPRVSYTEADLSSPISLTLGN
jgi:hypothetical protein